MKRIIDTDDLRGVAELAADLSALGYKVTRSHVTTWISRREDVVENGKVTRKANGFPHPLEQLAMGGVYLWSEVLPWVKQHYGDPQVEAA